MAITGDEFLAHPVVNKIVTRVMLLVTLWSVIWAIAPEVAQPPNGAFFTLLILFKLCMIIGRVVELIKLPSLLGMLVAGFLCTNVLKFEFDPKLSSVLRSFALAVILLRAGLGLDPDQLKKLSLNCLKLAFVPCLIEAMTIGVVGHWLLDIPYAWSFLLGFVLAAVSPAVVVPGMINLQERRLGTEKGVPTLVIAASSVDDVLAITGFGVALGFVFVQSGSLAWTIGKGPAEAVVGLLVGFGIGVLLRHFPAKEMGFGTTRSVLTVLCGSFAIFVSAAADWGGAGPLAALSMTFVAGLAWRKSKPLCAEQPTDICDELEEDLKVVWIHAAPFLFGLIGAEVRLAQLSPEILIWASLALLIGLIFRCCSVFLALFGSEFNLKEKAFVSMAWLPKATVQAAFGPVALDLARQRGDPTLIGYGVTILTVAVLSIMITAPIGAVLIALFGPRMLNQDGVGDDPKDLNITQANMTQMSGLDYEIDTSDPKMVSINLNDTEEKDLELSELNESKEP